MRYLLAVLALLAGLVVVIVVVGWTLPSRHRASRSATFAAPIDRVFAMVSDVEGQTRWRRGVKGVEVLERDATGRAKRWREDGPDGKILFEVVDHEEPRRLVTRIADPTLPFGGQWTFDLTRTQSGTTLTITEDGEVQNPVFRFVSHYVLGHSRTIDRYLEDLTTQLRGA